MRVLTPVVVRSFEPLWVEVQAADGREWVVPVWSKDDAPTIPDEHGGDGQNPVAGFRDDALHAITRELRERWKSDPGLLMTAGFVHGVRKPHKPGGKAESWEMTAMRIRRLGDDHRGNSAKKLLDRGRSEGLRSGRDWTPRGEAALESVDRAKAAICTLLTDEPTIQLDELGVSLDGVGQRRAGRFNSRGIEEPDAQAISQAATDAAIEELEAKGVARRRFRLRPV